MNKFTKIFLISILVLFSYSFASQAKATMSVAEIQALIAQLKAQITQLQSQLVEMKKEPKESTCKFNINLKLGDKGSSVESLQEVLEKEGFNLGDEKKSKYFGILTRLAVINFQERYGDEILSPLELKKGTGFVGNSTRLKLNNIYCNFSQESESLVKASFSYPLYSVLENESYAVITVNLSTSSDKDINVEYETFGGTATPNVDYYPAAGTLTFVSGQTSKTFQVQIINDNVAETDETVNLKLFNPKNVNLGEQDEAELDIIDNDHSTPTVYFSPIFYNVDESSNIVLNVSLSNSTPDTVTVNYQTSDFTATAGSDYQATNGTLTFAPNETSKSIQVSIINDNQYEGNESFNVTLKNPNNASLGLRFMSTITINDDEQAPPQLPTVKFYPVFYSVNENAGSVILNVSLVGDSANTVTVEYLTSDSILFPATAGQDYQAASGTLTFAPHQTSKTIPIVILNDNIYEGDEKFHVTLKNPVNTELPFLTKTATVTINDDEQAPPPLPTVKFYPVFYSVNENAGSVILNVSLDQESANTVSVSYESSNFSAHEGSDYQAVNGNLTFTPGQTSKTITVTIINNNVHELLESFNVTLKNPINAEVKLASKIATIMIVDDDPATPSVNFSPLVYSVNENVASVILYVSLSDDSANTVTVEYLTSDLFSATAGQDYQAASGILTFAPHQTSKTIPVVILDDSVYEGNEFFNVKLENPTNATLGLKTATVIIIDNESNNQQKTQQQQQEMQQQQQQQQQ